MFILAATPGPGLLLVSSQTSSHGLKAGFLTTLGIICADIVFILLVTLGLATLTKHLQFLMPWINIFGGCYLIFIGWQTIKVAISNASTDTKSSSNFKIKTLFGFALSGFLITVGNPKAIFFYISFLPAFVDLNQLSMTDISIIILTAILAITPTMLFCAWMTQQVKTLGRNQQSRSIFIHCSAALIITVGTYMLYRGITLII